MSNVEFKPHPSPGRWGSPRDPFCAACGQDISPNDVEIIERGVLWADGKPYHPTCFTHHPSQLEKRIAELEEALRIVRRLCAGDRQPNWADSMSVMQTRMRIVDLCEIADQKVGPK